LSNINLNIAHKTQDNNKATNAATRLILFQKLNKIFT